MNHSVYYFVSSPEQHKQYPEDFSSDIFSTYAQTATAESSVIVKREESLVYYTYLRRLSSDPKGKTFFGISIVLNGVITYNVRALFKIFERAYEQMVISGRMLQFADNGNVVIEPSGWDSAEVTSGETTSKISSYLEEGSEHFEVIPPINYGASVHDATYVGLSEGDDEVRSRIINFPTTHITKNHDLSANKFNSYSAKLAKLQEDNSLQKALISDLRNNRKESGTSSSFVWTLFSVLVLIIALVVIGYFTGHVIIQ